MKKEIGALPVHQPGDKTQGVFSFQGGKKGRRPQNVALGPALDDQDSRGERLEVRTSLAEPLERAGLVAFKMDTFGFKQHAGFLL
jgi:hypothetical protein